MSDHYGDGSGSGSGSGYGYGDGSGSGSGDGDGYGYGYDYGYTIGEVRGHEIVVLIPWASVRVGCRTLGLDEWRNRWSEIAKEEEVEVTSLQVEELLCKALSCVAARTEGALSSANPRKSQ